MRDFREARAQLTEAVAARAFPGAVVEVGQRAGVVWREAFGALTFEPDASRVRDDTIYDLASLTKVVATASLLMRLVEAGRIQLDDRVGFWLPAWTGTDREIVTVRDLLAHSGGLTAWLPLFKDYQGRREIERAICQLPLEAPPRTRAIYSDLGFMLLGFAIEDAGGSPLSEQFHELVGRLLPGDDVLRFNPEADVKSRVAPTEVDAWRGRLLTGEVHDENTWALGGVAGHAGLFGTAQSVGVFARAMLASLEEGAQGEWRLAHCHTAREFTTRSATSGSSRALGWDTMVPTSSCGTRMSPRAFGHTGFTGTSLWIDPEANVYVVLLTNRVHPSRTNEAIRAIRPALHDAVMSAI